jgi:hypothetical protein
MRLKDGEFADHLNPRLDFVSDAGNSKSAAARLGEDLVKLRRGDNEIFSMSLPIFAKFLDDFLARVLLVIARFDLLDLSGRQMAAQRKERLLRGKTVVEPHSDLNVAFLETVLRIILMLAGDDVGHHSVTQLALIESLANARGRGRNKGQENSGQSESRGRFHFDERRLKSWPIYSNESGELCRMFSENNVC